ncbi:MAG: hypothetical protein R2698_02290 [Microthrixaceae bacterium]
MSASAPASGAGAPVLFVTPYGRPASDVLAHTIADAARSGPLGPVTVVVSSNFVGLSLRRLLGSGSLAAAPRGIAGVRFVTPLGLSELITAADPRPGVTGTEVAAAIRSALAELPSTDLLARVAEHAATETALGRLYRELTVLDPAIGDSLLASGGLAASAARVVRAARQRLDDRLDETDRADAATRRWSREPDALDALVGPLVWFLPAPLPPPMLRMLLAGLRRRGGTVIAGCCGDEEADGPVFAMLAGAEIGPTAVGAPPDSATATVEPDRVVSVTDPDEEVRAVVRRILSHLSAGTPAERIAVFHPTANPYRRLLIEHLGAAGIPFNSADGRALHHSVPGRVLRDALALPTRRWRRDAVIALTALDPVRHRGERVDTSRWDRLSREAGVVEGVGDWSPGLRRFAAAPRDPWATPGNDRGRHRLGSRSGGGGGPRRLRRAPPRPVGRDRRCAILARRCNRGTVAVGRPVGSRG